MGDLRFFWRTERKFFGVFDAGGRDGTKTLLLPGKVIKGSLSFLKNTSVSRGKHLILAKKEKKESEKKKSPAL